MRVTKVIEEKFLIGVEWKKRVGGRAWKAHLGCFTITFLPNSVEALPVDDFDLPFLVDIIDQHYNRLHATTWTMNDSAYKLFVIHGVVEIIRGSGEPERLIVIDNSGFQKTTGDELGDTSMPNPSPRSVYNKMSTSLVIRVYDPTTDQRPVEERVKSYGSWDHFIEKATLHNRTDGDTEYGRFVPGLRGLQDLQKK